MQRITYLDFARGIAFYMMFLFHFLYNLHHFGFVNINFLDIFWLSFRAIIISLFVGISGFTFYCKHCKAIQFKSLLKNLFYLSFSAGLVSLSTYLMFPNQWIFFGILHFLVFCLITGVLMVKIPRFLGIIGLLMILMGYLRETIKWFDTDTLYLALKEPLGLPLGSLDFIYIFPWLGVFALGIYIAYLQINLDFKLKNNTFYRLTIKIGQNTLLLYLLHQPVLYGLAFVLYKLTF